MSLVPSVRIRAEVTRRIRQHARGSMTTEVCGVLIGDAGGAGTDIAAAIAAVNATQAGTHVTFTQDAWEHIYKIKDAEFPDARIVGWYHSHPGFGVFLSEHDLFIQENFFSAAGQVAWVFDPHTDEEGCFGWVEGKIARLESIGIVDDGAPVAVRTEPEDEEERMEDAPARRPAAHRNPWLAWVAGTSALAVALAAGFAVSHFLFPTAYPLLLPMNPVTGEPLIREPRTGQPVYMDPQRGKYVVENPHTGKLSTIEPEALKAVLPPGPPDLPPQLPPHLPKETK